MPYAQPLWRQIRDDLRAKIRAGIYPPGSKLPSVRLLADEYDTSHMTVRRAVDSMIELDELIGRTGIGVFVAEPPEQDS
ncbi:GntR family transcriptional regulator [Solwaraspora sp. WMMA2080]|uniref:GntR family transcriptional regulator n=1 Tax=unclassified Solwaraspora TaxID=2627926 RepID=UPI00248C3DD3|nr:MULTISPECIES: GntR family transcriptional regulator [unclassified Solwaraspora]WBC00170.1 GntR family transcriptional regulator [Solwaraspora sp. WMMA2059]WBC23763.1 GntR family transcriptional regulator [Solwaraspora sp. WMMA2080]